MNRFRILATGWIPESGYLGIIYIGNRANTNSNHLLGVHSNTPMADLCHHTLHNF